MSQILSFDFLASRSVGSGRASDREREREEHSNGTPKIDSYTCGPCLPKRRRLYTFVCSLVRILVFYSLCFYLLQNHTIIKQRCRRKSAAINGGGPQVRQTTNPVLTSDHRKQSLKF